MLGPSCFGWLARGFTSQVLSAGVAPHLAVISQLGVAPYVFLMGLELNTDLLRQRTNSSIGIYHGSFVVPFLLGGVSAWFYPHYAM